MSSSPSSSPTPATKRIAIIGAGWAGLVAAKTYLEINPQISLTILDASPTLGGVWSQDRCFPSFLADSPVGLFDFSDLPMRDLPELGLRDWQDLPSIKVFEYLSAYAEEFGLMGEGRMRLGVRVENIRRNGGGWELSVRKIGDEVVKKGEEEEVLRFDKVIIATGLNSTPFYPPIPREEFTGLVLHTKDIGLRHTSLTSSKITRITVYGGCKSAVDTIILCVQAGKHVDWVIRPNGIGNGPGLIGEVRLKGGIHVARLAGRWKNVLSPSIFATEGFWWWFLHSGKSRVGSWVGSWVCRMLWRQASKAPLRMEPYKSGGENIEKLRPEVDSVLFFTSGVWGLHGDAASKKFLAELKSGERITVHRASIDSLTGSTVKLSDNKELSADAFVFATGWNYHSPLFSPSDAIELGTTAPIASQSSEVASYWANLENTADEEVITKLPILKDLPPHYEREVKHTPYRLYRHILPSSLPAKDDRSLIFLGLLTNIQTSIYAEVSALWGVAWMEGLLDISKTKEEMDYDIALVKTWCERRYLGRGRSRQIASVEIQDVTDLLMKDLGLRVKRKGSWFGNVFAPTRAQDYRGIVRELVGEGKV